jgi:hypothetical protein
MPEVVVHGQGTSQEGGAPPPSPQVDLPVPGDEGYGAGDVPRGFVTQVGSSRVPDPRPTSPQAGPLLRCNNCGELGHLPRVCPNYGWYYPAPGKTRLDYEQDRQRVQDLIAGDIIREHEPDESEDYIGSIRPQDRVKNHAELQVDCDTCSQVAGTMCVTAGGGRSDRFHASRTIKATALDSPGTGG